LLVRSVVTTSRAPVLLDCCEAAAAWMAATDVAQACEIIGPLVPGKPRRAARVGAP
jgi:hypothetical protein